MQLDDAPQNQVDLESGFEMTKILLLAGHLPDAPAYVITWGRLAEVLIQILNDYGLSPSQLDGPDLLDLAYKALNALQTDNVLSWREIVRLMARFNPAITPFLDTPESDDEGSLTELYENATRLGDEDGYWVDGGASADLFDEY